MLKEDCICMVIGWPETWSKGAEPVFRFLYNIGVFKDCYFKVGHAAMCLIHKETLKIEYFDFGRYTCDHGQGRARGENTDPNLNIPIKAQINDKGELENIQELVDYLFDITAFTHGEGTIYFSLYDKMNYEKTIQFVHNIQEKGSVRYTTFNPGSTNCSRFVCGAILAGGTHKWDKIKLVITPTVRASPVGTAIDVGYQSNVFRQKDKDSPLENFKMSRWDNIKLLWNNTKGNLVGEKVVREDLIEANERPENTPKSAQWLGGLGEGNWIHLQKIEGSKHQMRVTSYYHNGIINYDTIVESKEGKMIDFDAPFKIIYNCSRLFISVEQGQQKMKFYRIKDYSIKIVEPVKNQAY